MEMPSSATVQSFCTRSLIIMKFMQTYHQLLDSSPLRFWFAGVFGGFLFVSAIFGRFYKQGSYNKVADARWERIAYLCVSGGLFLWGFWHIIRG